MSRSSDNEVSAADTSASSLVEKFLLKLSLTPSLTLGSGTSGPVFRGKGVDKAARLK